MSGPFVSMSVQRLAGRANRGQAVVEYTVLLGACMTVVIGLTWFVSAGYHQKLFDFWAAPLKKSLEYEVVGE